MKKMLKFLTAWPIHRLEFKEYWMSEINNIKSLGQSELATSRNATARDNQKTVNAEGTSALANRSDTVSLTNAAVQIQSLQQVIADVPVVDSERVASLKAAIADGSYSVNADELAQNLLSSESLFR